MLPENILQSDMLDIIFENRNKQYGAYTLRKEYKKRLQFSIAGTLLFAAVVSLFLMKAKHSETLINSFIPDGAKLINVIIPVREPEKPKQPPVKKLVAMVNFSTPIITDDNKVTDTLAKQEDLGGKIIGNTSVPGSAGTDEQTQIPAEETVNLEPAPEEPAGPVWHAEQMPEFPGGTDAYLKFMQKNLRQPDDINEGEKIIVEAVFVVNTDGSTGNAYILTSGRSDLDKEVLRVISRMPLWKPGMQNGQPVPVYFKMPVTFVTPEQ